MNTEGSYQFEKLENRHHEADQLAERANLRLEGFIDLLKRNQFPVRGKILEVGSAQGIRAKLMAENFPATEVIGIDRSRELLQAARAQNADIGNLSFLEADLYDLPFADETFDFVYARLVFMHLTDPIKAILSLNRVLKRGGRILIEDADRDCMFFEPAPKSFSGFWNKVQEGQRRLGGDPNVGRKLGSYMKETGLQSVHVETQPIIGGGVEINFLAKTLMPSLNTYLDPEDRIAGQAAIEDLLQLASDPRASFYHFWFVACGVKK